MSIPDPQSIPWKSDRAVLLVHGVGSATPGSYDALVAKLKTILDPNGQPRYAIYMLYYDYINEWFSEKFQASLEFNQLKQELHTKVGGPGLGNTVASLVGDVIWPVLSLDAREALRTALLRQIRQVVLDGSAVPIPQPKISIICHSMGCFHVFEALHEAANNPREQLGPQAGVLFENVIFMASPVQLISSVAKKILKAVPRPNDLACLRGDQPRMPSVDDGFGGTSPTTRRTVAITGNLDPVGGHFSRAKPAWAYMSLPGQISLIDQQDWVGMNDADLEQIFQKALKDNKPPTITPENPHDWTAYVDRHASDLQQWLP